MLSAQVDSTMRLPRDITRYLEDWYYHPLQREDFGENFLSARIAQARDRAGGDFEAKRAFVSLCAVPRGRPEERVENLQSLAAWLDPNQRQYDPPGLWLPYRDGQRFASAGILLVHEEHRPTGTQTEWQSYALVARDGYIEYGRRGGFASQGRLCFEFAPLVAWIQRFTAFAADLRDQLEPPPDYWIVLNIPSAQHATLCVLGDGWREPWDWDGSPPECLERNIQISRPFEPGDSAVDHARWFAERIANAFGEAVARCFNRERSTGTLGAPGQLPTNGLEFR